MIRLGVLAVVFGVACVQPGHVVCDNGSICPAGHTCTATGCVSSEQQMACEQKTDGDACTTAGAPGTCVDGACVTSVCGNSRIEPGEVCDDGNQVGDDGCNGTCTSLELCGNAIIELDEECDCGDATHPGAERCNSEPNGGSYCNDTCQIRRCGDGAMDPGEVCDDGNSASGDGCSADCASNEACGNATLDFFAGEQCDDGNTRTGDGCTGCLVEPIAWEPLSSTGKPSARAGAAMAYDIGRGRMVMFGGQDGTPAQELLAETWELVGSTWIARTSLDAPPARVRTAMAYDHARGRVVMFGGTSGGARADTWEWDGDRWTQASPAASPPARSDHALAYDAARGRIVLFGGIAGNNAKLADTWEYDGTTWTQRQPAASPTGRWGHAMAFDAIRGRIVLFGGALDNGSLPNDTHAWDGSTWVPITASSPPLGRYQHAMVYDVSRGGIVVMGGWAGFELNDTWRLVGTTWTQITGTTGAPAARWHTAAAYDVAGARTVVMGGLVYNTQPEETDAVYELKTTWSALAAPAQLGRRWAPIAYDQARGTTVLFGGIDFGPFTSFDETWELSDVTWRQAMPSQKPPARYAHALAYDGLRRAIVLFGGVVSSANTNDTWTYNGSTWSLVPASTKPGSRNGAAMAFDAARGRIVLFGGLDNAQSPGVLGDTWTLEGSTWTQQTPATSPPRLFGHAMTYDSKRQRVVLFGGQTVGNVSTNELWAWDGTTWTKRVTQNAPPERVLAGITYDAARDVLVVFGGQGAAGALRDTWELQGDADTWVPRSPPAGSLVAPSSGIDVGLVYNPIEKRVEMFYLPGSLNAVSTWMLRPTMLATAEVCTDAIDADDDGKIACADDDCWGACAPLCPPEVTGTCPTSPKCGDGFCAAIEDCHMCAADCACVAVCGDGYCDSPEVIGTCPGDCTP